MSIVSFLEHLGFSSLFERVNLGRGVLGRMLYGFVATMAVFALAIFKLSSPMFILIALALVSVLGLAFIVANLWYGHKHPAEAVLEDANLVNVYQLESAAKGIGVVQHTALVESPISKSRPIGDPNEPDEAAGRAEASDADSPILLPSDQPSKTPRD